MKKILALLLCACIAMVSLTACGNATSSSGKKKGNDKELTIGQTYTVKQFAEFTPLKITTTQKITPSMGGFLYYDTDSEYETYVDLILQWTNLSENDVPVDQLIKAKAVTDKNKEYEESFTVAETNNGTDLDQYIEITPDTTVKLHCAITVPTDADELTLVLSIQNSEFTMHYTLGTTESTATTLSVGDIVDASDSDNAAITFLGVEYTDDLCPSDTSSIYSHYSVDDPADTYLVVRFDITSYRTSEQDCDSFVHVDACFAGKYTYNGFIVVEDEDGKGFSGYANISPLSTRHFYYLFKVPKTVTANEVDLTIVFDEQEYIFTYQP